MNVFTAGPPRLTNPGAEAAFCIEIFQYTFDEEGGRVQEQGW